jgi:hypothetical protein
MYDVASNIDSDIWRAVTRFLIETASYDVASKIDSDIWRAVAPGG